MQFKVLLMCLLTSGCVADSAESDANGSDLSSPQSDGDSDVDAHPDAGENDGVDSAETCATEPGDAGCPCTSDCAFGCTESRAGKVCAETCTQDVCPDGTTCVQMDGSDEPRFGCRDITSDLGRPCVGVADCRDADTGSECHAFGDAGAFCSRPCEGEAYGLACVEGWLWANETCAPAHIAEGASTTCQVDTTDGGCVGSRRCEANGLTECQCL